MLVLTVCLFFIASGIAMSTNFTAKISYSIDESELLFEKFIKEYGKKYSDTEKQSKFRIFKQNLMKSNEFNAKYPHTVFGITKYFDITNVEYSKLHRCVDIWSYNRQGPQCQTWRLRSYPRGQHLASLDWRTQNAVTSVKDQRACGSCYAFSAIGSLEGQYAIQHNKLLDLSVQQILDCDSSDWSCSGGYMTNVAMYLTKAGGAMLAKDYPYKGWQDGCHFKKDQVGAKVVDCMQYPNLDEESLEALVQNTGPISVVVDASNFQYYIGGIFDNCGTNLNHAMLVVGFGEENGTPYWIVKNSYGPNFGEEGYIRIARGKNACGIINKQIISFIVN